MTRATYEYRVRPWLIPSLYTGVFVSLGFILPRIESAFFPHIGSSVSVTAAMTIYSAVASGMIALTGIVFSLTFVMVQFSASAYSPRLSLLMARDPFLAHALGTFIATFVYALAAAAWVDRVRAAHVPFLSSYLVLALLLASMGMFIALIERVGMLQVARMLTFTAEQGRTVITQLYERIETFPPSGATDDFRPTNPTQVIVHRGRPRAIQSVDIKRLVTIAKTHDVTLELVASVGDVVVELTPVFYVFGGRPPLEGRELTRAIQYGEQRTFAQDPKYAIRLLVDIAIRALSPAVNDPTTATQSLDQIGDLLVRLGQRRIEIGLFRDEDGTVRLTVPFPTWNDFLRLAFDEIRHYGADSVQVMRRMRALVADLISVLPEERLPALRYWQQRLQETIARSFSNIDEQADASQEDRQGLGTTRKKAALLTYSPGDASHGATSH